MLRGTGEKVLEETYGVLSENDSFFRKVNIHIIQCDDQIQTDQKITCEEELKSYMEKLELKGEGGTDFRPAFAYVDEMIRQHAFEHLRGMIYFTDGRGIYPAKRPVYETAFVFMEEEYEDVDVPPWAIKIILEEGQDFKEMLKYMEERKNMDIKRAKKEIKDSIEAYLTKDNYGEYKIPSIRQSPILLMGPPGIGKTQIMEQMAKRV